MTCSIKYEHWTGFHWLISPPTLCPAVRLQLQAHSQLLHEQVLERKSWATQTETDWLFEHLPAAVRRTSCSSGSYRNIETDDSFCAATHTRERARFTYQYLWQSIRGCLVLALPEPTLIDRLRHSAPKSRCHGFPVLPSSPRIDGPSSRYRPRFIVQQQHCTRSECVRVCVCACVRAVADVENAWCGPWLPRLSGFTHLCFYRSD